jgi:DNA (cytosine-5)-methyltransferase 1
MKHLDLFSGIGGFAIAVDEVWPNSEHIFCDNDKFCQAVLKKHWPKSKIYGDIRTIANAKFKRPIQCELEERTRPEEGIFAWENCDIITGGFPCQPFSQAGKRRGTEDNRYLWPEMFRVIQAFKPTYVIAENVRGLVTWNEGLVLEQVCLDLESEGYEVQPLVIPAVAVNAPHRRDRVWIIACHPDRIGRFGRNQEINPAERGEPTLDHVEGRHCDASNAGCERQAEQQQQTAGGEQSSENDTYALNQRLEGRSKKNKRYGGQSGGNGIDQRRDWDKNWIEVATELCSLDDGLPAKLGDFTCTKAQHRTNQLKAYGNAIVPQVAIEIMRSLENPS